MWYNLVSSGWAPLLILNFVLWINVRFFKDAKFLLSGSRNPQASDNSNGMDLDGIICAKYLGIRFSVSLFFREHIDYLKSPLEY